jgi:hypothetical protein
MATTAVSLVFAASLAQGFQDSAPVARVLFPPGGIKGLGSSDGVSQRAAKTLESALRRGGEGMFVERGSRQGPPPLRLAGEVWSVEDEGPGRGALHIIWRLHDEKGAIKASWSARSPSFRDLISSMPASGLSQPNGLAGEMTTCIKRAAAAHSLMRTQTLSLSLFSEATGMMAEPRSVLYDVSVNHRISHWGASDGALVALWVLGGEVAQSEIKPVQKGRRTTLTGSWNPIFGQRLLVALFSGSEFDPKTLPTGRLIPSMGMGIQEAVVGDGAAYALLSLHSSHKPTAWRAL